MAMVPMIRFKLFYFLIYISFTTHHFLNLYFHDIGLSGVEIGALKAASSMVMVFSQPVWGVLSDILKMRKGLLNLLLVFSGITFMFVPMNGTFSWICVMLLVYGFFKNPIVPIADSIIMIEVSGDGSKYSQVRLWGAVGMTASVVVMGYYFNQSPLRDLFGLYLVFTLLAVGVVLLLPKGETEFQGQRLQVRDFSRLFQFPGFVQFQLAILFLQTGAFIIDGFFGLYVQERVGNEITLGWALTLAGISEIVIYHYLGRWKRVFTARNLLFISALVSGVRWFLLARSTLVIQVFLLQLLHGITFGFFYISGVTYINQMLPEEFATSGQTMLWANAFGLAAVFGSVLGGVLYDLWNYQWLFLTAAGLAGLGALLFLGLPKET